MEKCIYCGQAVKQVGSGIYYCINCDDIMTERTADAQQ